MEEQLVKFKVARLAKKKGFKSKSRYYDGSGELVEVPVVEGNDYRHTNNMMQRFRYEAPTQSILQKWLREKHNLHIQVHFDCVKKKWETRIFILNEYINEKQNKVFMQFEQYNTYEKALENGLIEALKLIKV